jgi:hypothetical protein
MYEKISEKAQKKEKMLEESPQERKMKRMEDHMKSSVDQLWDLRGILFISYDASVEQRVQEAILGQHL